MFLKCILIGVATGLLGAGAVASEAKFCQKPLRVALLQKKHPYAAEFTFSKGVCLFQATKKTSKIHNKYLRWVSSRTITSPEYLMNKQRQIFYNHGLATAVFDSILSGVVGQLRPATEIELSLFNLHFERVGGVNKYSEYAFYLFKNVRSDLVTVYFLSNNEPYIPAVESVSALLKQKISEGEELLMHYHFHPFNFVNPEGDIAGTLGPSLPDLRHYMRLPGLKTASITNGIDTMDFSPRDIQMLYKIGSDL